MKRTRYELFQYDPENVNNTSPYCVRVGGYTKKEADAIIKTCLKSGVYISKKPLE